MKNPLSRCASGASVFWLVSDVLLWIEVVLLYSGSFFLLLELLGLGRMVLVGFVALFARFGLPGRLNTVLGFTLCAAVPLAPTLLLIVRYRLVRPRAAAILVLIIPVAIGCLRWL